MAFLIPPHPDAEIIRAALKDAFDSPQKLPVVRLERDRGSYENGDDVFTSFKEIADQHDYDMQENVLSEGKTMVVFKRRNA